MRRKNWAKIASLTSQNALDLLPFPGGGGTHILRQTGICRSNESLFHKKSLNMGLIFYKKSLNMSPFFQNHLQNFLVFVWKTPQNFENWTFISRKIPKNGHLFLPKWPLKMSMDFKASAANPHPIQIWILLSQSFSFPQFQIPEITILTRYMEVFIRLKIKFKWVDIWWWRFQEVFHKRSITFNWICSLETSVWFLYNLLHHNVIQRVL